MSEYKHRYAYIGKRGIGNGSTLKVQSVFPRGLIDRGCVLTRRINNCSNKTRTSTVASVRTRSVVRGAVLMAYIEDLWMQDRNYCLVSRGGAFSVS